LAFGIWHLAKQHHRLNEFVALEQVARCKVFMLRLIGSKSVKSVAMAG